MDITLERILSLIPKKENGDYQHGALKAFANSIGLRSGNLIADWVKGRSESYKNYIYEVSAKYNVSVEWLKGETDDPSMGIKKERPADGEAPERNITVSDFISAFETMSDADILEVISAASEKLKKNSKTNN